ncbi:FkbM family methyltransferase [Leptolyngbya sp. CCNP1308]|uniref:FkbM family methyltransferase n=1 Tax=Leptolyngbya sp. CCNP1308 TaxID=3110255 RepID=UPI002B21DA9F|nr:FkbM family methyltransferase [Leptolyngbya sp. CCNP1308]MEA5452262.1 FkbM family methyltransferase [Leptolyngbya sp. CCNP1308]
MVKSLLSKIKKGKNRLIRAVKRKQASYIDTEKAEQIFYISYLEQGMIVFDIGANIGELTLLFSRFVGTSGKVYAFEACVLTFQKLSNVCKLSGRPQIHLNQCAVADKDGILKLNIYDEKYSGWNTLAYRPLENYGIDIKPISQEEVTAITLDQYCIHHKIDHIDLLKIDVEGAEYQVMLGARILFASQRIRCCVFEFGATTFDMGNTPSEIEVFLKDCGYVIRNIVKDNPIFPGGHSSQTAQFSLHIATPKV